MFAIRIVLLVCFHVFYIGESVSMVLPIAHRGASAYAPENTISAIRKAIDMNIKFIEIDVHMTKDEEVVAIHDITLSRTSNQSGKVNDFTLKELKSFDFGQWFSKDFKNERIPTLKEILEITKDRAILIIELKYGNERYPNIESKVVNLVRKMNLSKSVILKSFSTDILNTFKQLAPNIKRLYCTFGGTTWITLDNFLRFKNIFEGSDFHYIQVHKFFLTDWIIGEAHKKNIKVIVWDVHDKETMKKMVNKGVDFIESNNPDYILNLD